MTPSHTRLFLSSFWSCLGLGWLIWIASCTTVSDQIDWIQVGKTTKAEIVARYGEPDLVRETPEGEIATYRPASSRRQTAPIEIPTAQPGPFGTMTARPQPIDPGLGAHGVEASTHERPKKEIQIRYDVQSIVQEVLE